ncbi:hypothetical protein B9Z55_002868 [Caenorhabditis nigoni]|uniref:Uncharacterized protein n=1 Tax=Caenorhabditis nigoni TaxID=1611254 RepID=A0A2G5VMH3_9PELO|nr:hypothetical protein B9Z55_002868 [Caenorhabditis nigoni]
MPFLRRFSACSLIESTNFRSFHLPVAGLCEKDDVEEGETTSTADRCEKDILRNVGSIIGIQFEAQNWISITSKKEEKRVERKERGRKIAREEKFENSISIINEKGEGEQGENRGKIEEEKKRERRNSKKRRRRRWRTKIQVMLMRLLLLSAAGYNEKYVGKRRKRSRLLVDVMNAILRNVGSIIGIQCEVRKSISITNKKEEKRVERKERRKGKKKKESRHDLEFETTKPTTISAKTSVAMMIVKFLLISIFK